MQYAPVASRATVKRWYPAAVKIVKVDGGFLAFFNYLAYRAWTFERRAS